MDNTTDDFSLLYMKVKEKVIKILKQNIEYDDVKFVDAIDLKSINLNSITFIKVIVAIEEEFNIEFEEEDLALNQYPTLRDLVAFVLVQKNN